MSKIQKINQLNTVLNVNGNNENQIQKILEDNPELIPLPFLQNHRLHSNLIFKKFPLPNAQETDFLYLTKSTVEWWCVLVEIESSNKKIFNSSTSSTPVFSAEFNNAYDQILSWKGYLLEDSAPMKSSILPLLMHMHRNSIVFKYVLIIGRNSELDSQIKINLFNQKNTNDIKIMTYDSLINSFTENPIASKIIAVKSTIGYKIKSLNNADTSLFSYLKSGEITFDDSIKNELVNKGYNVNAWKNGELLKVNDKEPMSNFSKTIKKAYHKSAANMGLAQWRAKGEI